MPAACVAYSGTAANAVSSSISISRRRGFIVPPQREHDRVAFDRLRDRLVDGFDERERAEQRAAALRLARRESQARHRQDDVRPALQRVEDERRRGADHLLELVVGYAARLEGIED